jgi:hypothetical protein
MMWNNPDAMCDGITHRRFEAEVQGAAWGDQRERSVGHAPAAPPRLPLFAKLLFREEALFLVELILFRPAGRRGKEERSRAKAAKSKQGDPRAQAETLSRHCRILAGYEQARLAGWGETQLEGGHLNRSGGTVASKRLADPQPQLNSRSLPPLPVEAELQSRSGERARGLTVLLRAVKIIGPCAGLSGQDQGRQRSGIFHPLHAYLLTIYVVSRLGNLPQGAQK